MSSKKTAKKTTGTKTAAKTARTPAPQYSEEKAKKARAGHHYIKVGDKRGTLALTGAAAMFKKNPDFVYLPNRRIAGRRADVERVLEEQGFNVKEELAGAHRAGSEKSEAFLAEVEAAKAFKARGGASKAKGAELPHSIAYYAEQVDKATVETKSGAAVERKSRSPKAKKGTKKAAAKKGTKKAGTKSKSASPRGRKAGTKSKSKSKSKSTSASPAKKRGSPKGKRGAKPLADKLEALGEDKVMDVSNLHVDGSGAKVVKQPGSKSKKVLVPGTRLVSDKKNGIKAAAKLLGDESLVQKWVDAKAGGGAEEGGEEGETSRSRSSSPARTHAMSPRPLSPSASLPPLPSVRSSSPRSTGSGVQLPRVPTLGSPRG